MRRVPVTVVPGARLVAARVDPRTTVGEVAGYLSGAEANVDCCTLDLAQAVALDERISQLDLASGDRIAVMPEPGQASDLPLAARAGERGLIIRAGAVEIHVAAQRQIIAGKPDERRGQLPDVDLRMFVPPEALDFISRDCMRLQYIDGRWYAQRSGQTRIVIDDLEVGAVPVLLNEAQRVRFYRATESDLSGRPLASIEIIGGVAEKRSAIVSLPGGSFALPLLIGSERGTYFLNTSDHLTVRQVAAALLHHSGQSMESVSAFVLRLLAPVVPVAQVVRDSTLLYARTEGAVARHLLLLKDVNRSEKRYQLAAGQGSERKLIGWYSGTGATGRMLDLDLSESLTPHLEPAASASPVKAYLHFSPTDQSWAIRAEDAGKISVFLNHTRISAAPQRLNRGDVIGFGLTPTQSFVRLQVDFRSEHAPT